MLEKALDIFLERGFEQATMEDVATAAGMSKRTVYARYQDKAALFKATVRRAIKRYTVPIEIMRAADTGDLETTLTAVARIRIANVMTPNAIKLQRILNAQSYRFPELFHLAFEEGAGPTIEFLRDVFARHAATGEVEIERPGAAASAFLSLAVGGSARLVVSGNAPDEAEREARIRFAVQLFLNGVRARKQ